MPMNDQPKSKKPLAALVGSAALAILAVVVPQFEGTVYHGYRDPIGIVTACTGNTDQAVMGKTYTKAECDQILEGDLVKHAEGVDACVPLEPLTTGQRAAAVSFAFNVGVTQFCKSTFARKLRAKDPTACAELSKWVYAGGRELPGLVKRRKAERDICEGKTFPGG
jgi:lysozyme